MSLLLLRLPLLPLRLLLLLRLLKLLSSLLRCLVAGKMFCHLLHVDVIVLKNTGREPLQRLHKPRLLFTKQSKHTKHTQTLPLRLSITSVVTGHSCSLHFACAFSLLYNLLCLSCVRLQVNTLHCSPTPTAALGWSVSLYGRGPTPALHHASPCVTACPDDRVWMRTRWWSWGRGTGRGNNGYCWAPLGD